MSRHRFFLAAASLVFFTLTFGRAESGRAAGPKAPPAAPKKAPVVEPAISHYSAKMLRDGEHTFRYDTFGDEAFWGGTLKLHEAIEGAKLGGVGPDVSPATALAVGMKIDINKLPGDLLAKLKRGAINLNDPAVTVALLKLNAVIGVTGAFNSSGTLQSVG